MPDFSPVTIALTENLAAMALRMSVQVDYLLVYWFIPLGIVILWIYGRYHFNSPTYKLSLNVLDTASYSDESHLTSSLPPSATTRINYFRTYATRYTVTLITIFIVMTTMYPLLKTSLHTIHWAELPDSPSTKDSAIISLLVILGLIPSIPFGKKVGSGLLEYFHKKARIPSDASVLARDVIGAEYRAKDDTIAFVRNDLKKRDTRRVAEGQAKGELEEKIIKLRCLDKAIEDKIVGDEYSNAKSLLSEDFERVKTKKQLLIDEINQYLDLQEALVDGECGDIDEFIQKTYVGLHRDYLIAQRKLLMKKLEYLHELICFVLSVSLIITDKVSRRINRTLSEIGFDVAVNEPPPLAVDTIVKVAASVFALQAMFYFGLHWSGVSYGQFSETTTFEIGALNFLAYLLAMSAATGTMKWAYRRRMRGDIHLLCGVCSYAVTFWINAIISLKIRSLPVSFDNFLANPVNLFPPMIFAINQGVLGYFTAIYVESRFKWRGNIDINAGDNIDYVLAVKQGLLQSAPFALAYIYRLMPQSVYSQSPVIIAVGLVQALISGCLAGVLFQSWYCRPDQATT